MEKSDVEGRTGYMKKVFLYAYDSVNLGDDLFVLTIAHRYPAVRFYMWSDRKNADNFKAVKNIKVINRNARYIKVLQKKWPSIIARIRQSLEQRCKAVVYIGGSLFIEYENWPLMLNWWEYEANNHPFYVLGANFGPYHTEDYRKKLAEIFSKMKDVCFRDTFSKEKFCHIPSVRYAPDILLGYPMPKVSIKEKQAFFSIINCAAKNEGENKLEKFNNAYNIQMANFIQQLLHKGWKIILSSFCREEGDEYGITNIFSRLENKDSVSIINYNGKNRDILIYAMAESQIVFASRFHATILGLAAKRPVIPIVYSDKTLHILEDLNFHGKFIDIRKMNEEKGYDITQFINNIEDQSVQNIEQFVHQSEGHFEKLDRLLKE